MLDTCPVMYPAAGIARKATAEAVSAGSPSLTEGVGIKDRLVVW